MASLKTNKKNARIRDGQQCQICGDTQPVPFGRLEVHHIIHRCQGGSDDLDNLVTLCDFCHAQSHKHMGPAWVGLSNLPPGKRKEAALLLIQAKEEFESYLRLPIEKRNCIQDELWSEWGIQKFQGI